MPVTPTTGQQTSPGGRLNQGGADQTPSETITISTYQSTENQRQSAGQVLKYPKKVNDVDSDYVMFNFYNYVAPYSAENNNATGNSFLDNYTSSGTAVSKNLAEGYKTIILYMPQDISTSFGGGWNGFGVGAGTVGALNITNLSGSDITNGIKNLPGMAQTALQRTITGLVNNFTGSDITVNQALSATSGRIVNPNVELLYEAPKLRNFGLKFKLVSNSKEESDEIRKIYNTFKKATLPTLGGNAFGFEVGNLLTLPKLCQVDFMKGSKRNQYLPYYKLCGITALDINFTADGTWAAFANGDPVSVEISLGFLETKIAFAQEVKEEGGGI
jgi:hypothetical protein